ncbi:hypothetical protein PENTCL1PPCAC_12805 [Pristionchus entomophagus]|uniref:NR LBD domain-containing protein n=1 Tax=Pristionchus entomophagus TaxID=358040 RepID=A0AAV5TDR3_9BILA|nr:hypothetical protein PENTCL1PPCAC_12805 [Pristionchus entomophagus]
MIPMTYGMMNQTTRILISSIFEFAYSAFDGFRTLSKQEQTQLVHNFYPFISTLDSAYRMHKYLPERETMCLVSYASYLDVDTIATFLSDTPNSRYREEATRMMNCYLTNEVRPMREKMKRWNPSEDEFMAFVGISFWSLERTIVSEQVHQMADKYREQLLRELDTLYRDILQLDYYASRMGEALLFLASIQGSFFEMRSNLGVLKLMDVFEDHMLMAQLHE